MPNQHLWAGALTQCLIFQETGHRPAAMLAMVFLERLADDDSLDGESRQLVDRASQRIADALEARHGRHA